MRLIGTLSSEHADLGSQNVVLEAGCPENVPAVSDASGASSMTPATHRDNGGRKTIEARGILSIGQFACSVNTIDISIRMQIGSSSYQGTWMVRHSLLNGVARGNSGYPALVWQLRSQLECRIRSKRIGAIPELLLQ